MLCTSNGNAKIANLRIPIFFEFNSVLKLEFGLSQLSNFIKCWVILLD